jgi:hypothetical protein
VWPAFEVVQQQHLASFVAQFSKPLENPPCLIGAFRRAEGRLTCRAGAVDEWLRPTDALAANMIARMTPRDLAQPCAETAGIAAIIDVSDGVEERILADIVRRVGISRDDQRRDTRAAEVPECKLICSLAAASGANIVDEVLI